jgi:hypothetical protein
MIIESINDQDAIKGIEKDIKGMIASLASLKKHRNLAKKVSVAFKDGRIDQAKRDGYMASLEKQIASDLFNIQGFGLALGQADEADWDMASDIMASHIINKASK